MGITEKLIRQSKKPTGIVGKILLGIMNGAHRQMTRWGLAHIVIPNNGAVLDVGCGGGKTIKYMSKHSGAAKLYGIDISPASVSATLRANKKAVALGRVAAVAADVCDIPFDDAFFDVVIAVQTHYYWSDLKKAMAEIYRVVKPDGVFLLIAENYKMNYHMPRYKTMAEQRALLLKTGFIKTDVHSTGRESCFVSTK